MSVTMITPDRSLEQRLSALELANDIRSRRAELKRDLKAGRRSLMDVLVDPPEWLLSAKVFELLLCVPKIGRTKAGGVFAANHVSPMKTFGGLSGRQRAALVEALEMERERREDGSARRMAGPAPGRVLNCVGCGTRMLARSRDGLCGFCQAEDES